MKSIFRNTLVKLGAAIALAVAGLLGGTAAQAAGTVSGTTITNLATLNYSVGAVAQTFIESKDGTGNSTPGLGKGAVTTFVVDNMVNLQVTTLDTNFVSVVPGQTTGVFGALGSATATQVARFLVTNTGNSTQDYALTPLFNAIGSLTLSTFSPTSVTDNFDPSACTVRVESGASTGAVYDATDTATFIDALAADANKTVYVICAIPLTQVNNQIAVVSLTAEARVSGLAADGALGAVLDATIANTQTGVEIVFADSAGIEPGDVARDGKHSSRDALRVTTASLTVLKAMTTVCDPLNGPTNPKNIPGAFVRYTITVANGGSTLATLTTVGDALDVNKVNFDTDFIGGATAAACVIGSPSVPSNGTGKGFSAAVGTTTAAAGAPAFTARTGYPQFFTSAADTDGVSFATPNITANFSNVLNATGGAALGELRAGESISVSYQVQIR